MNPLSKTLSKPLNNVINRIRQRLNWNRLSDEQKERYVSYKHTPYTPITEHKEYFITLSGERVISRRREGLMLPEEIKKQETLNIVF